VNGRLKQDRWQDDTGGNRSKISIVGNQVQFLDLKNGDGEQTTEDELY
jgi:single-stranded DNA-binding protein